MDRRGFLRRLVVGAGIVAAGPTIMQVLASVPSPDVVSCPVASRDTLNDYFARAMPRFNAELYARLFATNPYVVLVETPGIWTYHEG